jgi:4-oxalocrotonate tautomerase
LEVLIKNYLIFITMITTYIEVVNALVSCDCISLRRIAMPFVNIKIAGPNLSPEQLHRLHAGVTALMADVMHKKAELTAVLVEQVPAHSWAIGGNNVRAAAHLDVKVTEGTNTAVEKARFIGEAMQLLKNVLGAEELHPATYVAIDEVAADAWGYDGRTQDARRHAAASA